MNTMATKDAGLTWMKMWWQGIQSLIPFDEQIVSMSHVRTHHWKHVFHPIMIGGCLDNVHAFICTGIIILLHVILCESVNKSLSFSIWVILVYS